MARTATAFERLKSTILVEATRQRTAYQEPPSDASEFGAGEHLPPDATEKEIAAREAELEALKAKIKAFREWQVVHPVTPNEREAIEDAMEACRREAVKAGNAAGYVGHVLRQLMSGFIELREWRTVWYQYCATIATAPLDAMNRPPNPKPTDAKAFLEARIKGLTGVLARVEKMTGDEIDHGAGETGPPDELLSELTRDSQKILKIIWDRKPHSEGNVYREVWDEPGTDDRLRVAVNRLNNGLTRKKLSQFNLEISRKNGFITLKDFSTANK